MTRKYIKQPETTTVKHTVTDVSKPGLTSRKEVVRRIKRPGQRENTVRYKATAKSATQKQAIQKLWRMGRLAELKLDSTQMEIYNQFHNSSARRFVINCSRRLGKSYLSCVMCLEAAIRNPGWQLRYAAPSAKMVKKIINPLLREICLDCPADVRPKFRSQENIWAFPNGSEIHVAGTDLGHAEGLRGTGTNFAVVDEAGFVDELDYVIGDILMPQTLTTNGRLLLTSTPSRSPDHPFIRYIEEAKELNAYVKKTIYDNPRITPETIEEYAMEAGGKQSSTFRREYLCEIITDYSTAVIPEFNLDAEADIVRKVERPTHFDSYVSMDAGFVDNTAVLFGYWHFEKGLLVIEDEILLNRMTTETLATSIELKEKELWDSAPLRRISDIDLILVADLASKHGLSFSPAQKDNKEAAINALRLMIQNREIAIHPRCHNLIRHLRHATWNKARTKFERSMDNGHYDCVDALIYMVRSLSKGKNPYPNRYDSLSRKEWIVRPSSRSKPHWAKNIFNPHRGR